MLDQLFRQEALDAYSDRWLGEPSARLGMRSASIAIAGSAMLAALLALLLMGSYTRKATLEGVANGSKIDVGLTEEQAHALTPGASLTLEWTSSDGVRGAFSARIDSIAPAGGGAASPYQMRLITPSSFGAMQRKPLRLRIPVERRQIYEWMFLCSRS